ncbi:hypothetical protein [Microvirga tunisiensis]|uniref:Uncharacterized protein n=1 Tax=Microvirga tunisiensis TaxID=2108360 RepID=A0A5N7MUG7_9HYPH|nr:hypothetical protein [Microvirga tunisiensis]MPR12173.1 hypothetical protein [Microvirga tunisiensis]MPR30119.1 hypothetical protein [Microvirga tunisiensis]
MPTLHLVVSPVGRGKYAAHLNDREMCRSPTPFFAAARVLLAQGFDPATLLTMRHEGSAIISIRATIGQAAGRTVHEGDKDSARIVRLKTVAANGLFTEFPDPRPQTAKVGPVVAE